MTMTYNDCKDSVFSTLESEKAELLAQDEESRLERINEIVSSYVAGLCYNSTLCEILNSELWLGYPEGDELQIATDIFQAIRLSIESFLLDDARHWLKGALPDEN